MRLVDRDQVKVALGRLDGGRNAFETVRGRVDSDKTKIYTVANCNPDAYIGYLTYNCRLC